MIFSLKISEKSLNHFLLFKQKLKSSLNVNADEKIMCVYTVH